MNTSQLQPIRAIRAIRGFFEYTLKIHRRISQVLSTGAKQAGQVDRFAALKNNGPARFRQA